ncbi:DinB family protein [Aureivirga sp. CE67]|uniref:DinB family protein n=1 Tax=Aureivirga sp. CE67 TaxID=1788983 RepID=UPI0018CB732C|nr:DinB family protein [Aureivirga sp. CE67]
MILTQTEYAPFYQKYFELNTENNILEALQNSEKELTSLLDSISEENFNFSYAENKWTIKELMQHLIDNERVFAYRAMRFSRNDQTPLNDYDEKTTIPFSNANHKSKADLMEEYTTLRKSSISLFKSFSEEMLLREGIASNNNMSVRALGFLISAHQRHHQNVLRERYLSLL